MAYMHDDYCLGCACVEEVKQVNLPTGWTERDPLPVGLTVHWTRAQPRRFAFLGVKAKQHRHYFD